MFDSHTSLAHKAAPVVYLSANPADLRGHRVKVRKMLEADGIRVEELDSPVGKHWNAARSAMREKLKLCDVVVHLVGICHGAEPKWQPTGAPKHSFAQMEYHLACELKMPCHIIFFSPQFPYDPHTRESLESRHLQNNHRALVIARTAGRSEEVVDLEDLKLRVATISERIKPKPKPPPPPPAPPPAPPPVGLVPGLSQVGPPAGSPAPHRTPVTVASREHSESRRRRPAPRGWVVTWAMRLPLIIMLCLAALYVLHSQGYLRGRARVVLHSPDALLSGMSPEEVAAENEDTLVDTVDPRTLAREVVQLSTLQGGLRDQYDPRTKNELAEAVVATRRHRSVRALRNEVKEWAQGAISSSGSNSLNRGIAAYLQGNYKLASREAWQFASDAEAAQPPSHPRALSGWLLQGHSHLQMIELSPALTAYRRALTHTSQDSAPLIWCDIALMEAITLQHLGRWSEAMPVFREVIRVRTLYLAPDAPEIASAMTSLAHCYLAMSMPDAAESLLRDTLAMTEKRLGANHAETAAALGTLGEALRTAGQAAEAQELLNRALAILDKPATRDDPSVARYLSSLARLTADTGKPAEAEPLCQRALQINERKLGPDHPRVDRELTNLALIVVGNGNLEKAVELQRRSLFLNEKYFGAQHPEVATALNNLAGLLQHGEPQLQSEVEGLFRRALLIDETVFGPEHPNLVRDMRNLGAFLKERGRFGEALPFYRRAISITELSHGKEHPEVAILLRGQALILCQSGQNEEAVNLCTRALAIAEKGLGPDHPEVAQCAKDLAFCLCAAGKLSEAEPYYTRALAINEKALGADDVVVFWDVKNLAALLRDLGDRRRALPLFRRVYAMARRNFGPEHPRTVVEQDNLACMMRDTKNYEDAELLFREVLTAREKHVAADDPALANDISDLAGVLFLQGRHAEAEPLYRRALDILAAATRKDGKAHPLLESARQNYRADLRHLRMSDEQIAERIRQVESGEAVQDLAAAESKG